MTAWVEQELFYTQGRLRDRSEAIAVPGMFHMFIFLFLMDNTLQHAYFFFKNTTSMKKKKKKNKTMRQKQRELTAHLEV